MLVVSAISAIRNQTGFKCAGVATEPFKDSQRNRPVKSLPMRISNVYAELRGDKGSLQLQSWNGDRL